MSERRQAPRAVVSTTAMVLARHNDPVEVTLESISTSGARFVGTLTLNQGERVQILFDVDDRPVEIASEVVRVEHHDISNDRVAAKFVDVDDETMTLLRRLVQRVLDLDDRE